MSHPSVNETSHDASPQLTVSEFCASWPYGEAYSTTESDSPLRTDPMARKGRPMQRNVPMTHAGVRMGCHAGSRCCLKGVSAGAVSGGGGTGALLWRHALAGLLPPTDMVASVVQVVGVVVRRLWGG